MRRASPPSDALEDRAAERPRGRPGAGAVLGASAAALVSAGLVFWIATGGDSTLSEADFPAAPQVVSVPVATPAPAQQPRTPAPSTADQGQVARAYVRLREIYAEEGAAGVASFSRSCPDAVLTNPAELDFCLAFDAFAAALEGDDPEARAWREAAGARELALAASALPPGVDAAGRVADIRALVRRTSLGVPAASKPASGRPVTKPTRAPEGIAACRLHAVAAPLTVCASADLRQADSRLRAAHRKALAAGVGARRLAREQARFRSSVNAAAPDRAAVARLYKTRTRALEAMARRG